MAPQASRARPGAGVGTGFVSDPRCLWCSRAFRPRRGGSPQRFCSSAHRAVFHSAARRFAEGAVAAGIVTLDAIKNGDLAACTLLRGGISSATALAAGGEEDGLGVLLETIFNSLSPDELAELPESVWALLEFIAGPDAGGAEA